MSAKAKRIEADISKINALVAQSHGAIKLISSNINKLSIDLNYRTVADRSGKISEITKVEIQLPERYPFVEPKVIFKTIVFHPNVYSSGQVCLGTKWIPTEGLDLLLERLIKILVFDATILNTKSPANSEALRWYQKKVTSSPNFFPTDTFKKGTRNKSTGGIKWNDTKNKTAAGTIVSCTSCGQKIRVQSSGSGMIKCPKCKTAFKV